MSPYEKFYPPSTRPENVPAFASEDASRRRVVLTHPTSARHPNVLAAEERYRARGWAVAVSFRAPVEELPHAA